MDEIRGIAAKYFGKDNVILVGNSTSDHDLESSFASDNIVISVLTALFVMIILFFTFQSAGLPVLLVLTIQGSIWINFAVPAMRGQTIFFIAYLIVSADGCNDRLCNRYFQQIHGSETENADQRCDY